MAITTRQSNLLVAEDWTKIYQTFRNADFQSYDFQTLRKSMIDYIRLYYPEDFNDFIESSEFIALIDLIAFLGQSLAFRGDLNARENFIDTAQRRDSVLKLARLISYNPKRNIPASGFLKIDSVSTTEQVFDSNGLNLSGLVINWNDPGNNNWLEQFTIVLNASLYSNQVVGNPSNSQIINNILNEEYQINLVPNVIPTYSFNSLVDGAQTKFEIVSPTSLSSINIYEKQPNPNNGFNLLYKNDNLGNGSVNTGFFLYFKQGELKYLDFNFQESVPNRLYAINTDNINNSDIWLYSLTNQKQLDVLWSQVPVISNNNIIYNQTTNKNIYQVNSRANDQIDLIFGDGSFANIPQGNFRLFYRVSNGLTYKITPDEMKSIITPINYISRAGRAETINIRSSLQYTVANSSSRETVEEIKQKAPQQYYTQNRMVNGEDYNILPYTLFNNILKVKATNRTSSGISRYLDVIDTTGNYSSTNIFADDGHLYKETFTNSFTFEFNSSVDIKKVIYNQVASIAESREVLHLFYADYTRITTVDTIWNYSANIPNGSTGYFYNSNGTVLSVGKTVFNNNSFIRTGAIVKFYAGDNYHFDAQNNIASGPISEPGDKYFIYTTVLNVIADGANDGLGILANGFGAISISSYVPTGATVAGIFPTMATKFSQTLIDSMTSLILSYKEFALRYDIYTYEWKIVDTADIGTGEFSIANAGNTDGIGSDNSWIIYFQTTGLVYKVNSRGLNYAFESTNQTNFYFDNSIKIYDPKTGFTVKDQIKVLKINNSPDMLTPLAVDYTWNVYKNVVEVDGYENSKKILITFADSNNDGLPDNPELFEIIVDPLTNSNKKFIYFKNTYGYNNFVTPIPVDTTTINSMYSTLRDIELNQYIYTDGQLFYTPTENKFYQLSVTGTSGTINVAKYALIEVFEYYAMIGRQDLYFQYRHNSPNYRRIDPSPNNLIDLYILTKQYATDYSAWIRDTSNKIIEPTIPTTEELTIEFSNLEQYKSISDAIIYNSAKFKPIFGTKAPENLRAIFKVIKNPSIAISDNDIKSSVISAINDYFDISNWDFGETFYFSELSAYLHNTLAPNISSVIIVPASANNVFGSLMQINANYNEIITSAATVDNVEIISAITASQLNQVGVV
jgi:hypothetical protein